MTSHTSTTRIYCCFIAAGALLGTTLSTDAQVTGYRGDYNYDGASYRGITNDVINTSVTATEYVSDSVSGTSDFLNRTMNFGAWRASNNAYALGTAGLGFQMQGPFINNMPVRSTGGVAPDPWVGFKFGPFYMDEVYGGVGAMYSDYSGSPIYGSNPNPGASEDNWASIIWAQARLTMYVTDRFAISLNPSIYWLPLEGEVGWGIGSLFGAMGGNTGPNALIQMGLRVPLSGGFEVAFFEEFRAVYPQVSIIRNSPYYWASLGDSTAVDFAGRYQFGGFGGAHQIDSTGGTDFALNDSLFDKDFMFFMNRAGFSLRGQHSGNIYSNLYYDRLDYWDNNFDNHQGWQTIGALLIQQGPVFSPYARYELTATDHFKTHYQYGVVGANMRFSPDLLAYAEGGWMVSEIENQGSSDSWVAKLGFRHRLGPYTSHGVDVGRYPVENFFNRYLATFAQYYLLQQIGPKANVRLFAQQADLDVLGGSGPVERTATTVGLLAEIHPSPNSTISFSAAYENTDIPSIQRGYELWTYRLMYARQFGQSINGICYYQYQEAGSGISTLDRFSEHLLFVGMAKRF